MRRSAVLCSIVMLLVASHRASAQDVRGARWGDSIETVIASEKELTFRRENSKEDPKQVFLVSNEHDQICSEKAIIRFRFYEDELISVAYDFDIGETNNPFEHDGLIRSTLTEKYGEQTMKKYAMLNPITGRGVVETTVATTGLKGGQFDSSDICSRKSEWILPSHTITLLAFSSPMRGQKDVRILTLSYESQKAAELEERRTQEADNKREAERAKDRTKL